MKCFNVQVTIDPPRSYQQTVVPAKNGPFVYAEDVSKLLNLIETMCGNPDSGQACRNILKEIGRFNND